jgi:hypothetical protein
MNGRVSLWILIMVFWVVTLYSLAGGYERFVVTYRFRVHLHLP